MKPSPHRRALLARFGLAFALCVSACRRNAPPGPELVVGVSALRISLPVFVAAERGVFAQHGLRVRLRSYPTAQPMLDDLALGRLDAAGFAAWPILLHAAARGTHPLHVGASVLEDRTHRLSYVLARRGSGVRFPRDAAGRRIGVLPTIAYRRWLPAILQAANIATAGVTTVPVAPPLQAQSLAAGAVDLMFTNDPMATAMLQRGVAEIADDGPPCATRLGDPFSFGAFAIGDGLVRRDRDRALRLSASLDDAVARTLRDQSDARAAMRPHLRPDERDALDHSPPTRFAPAREVSHALSVEVSRSRALGIFDGPVRVLPLDPSAARPAP